MGIFTGRYVAKVEAERDLTQSKLETVRKEQNQTKKQVESLQDEIKDLRKALKDQDKLVARGIELDARESLLEAKQNAAKTFDQELERIEKEKQEAVDTSFKAGYADGVADGLRKVHEITAEDRKQANQIAMMAAASHSAEAVQMLATQKGLGDGTSSKK